jgi:hypothetical protein
MTLLERFDQLPQESRRAIFDKFVYLIQYRDWLRTRSFCCTADALDELANTFQEHAGVEIEEKT